MGDLGNFFFILDVNILVTVFVIKFLKMSMLLLYLFILTVLVLPCL